MKEAEGRDALRILGLDEDSGSEELKAAFRYLSKKYHPDSSGNPNSAPRFARVASAYRSLRLRFDKAELLGRSVRSSLPRDDGGDLFSLGSILMTSIDAAARKAAARKLGFSGKKAAWVFLRHALRDEDEAVVRASLRSIANLSLFQAAGELAALYVQASPTIKTAILDTAEETGEPLFFKALEAAVADGHGLEALRARRIRRSLQENA